LRPGTHRFYPYADVACHVLGNLSRVSAEEIKKYNRKDHKDPLRDYAPNDLIGRSGIENLCEPALRGTRGLTESTIGEETILTKSDPAPGQDVRLSIDIELQQQIQEVFASATLRDARGAPVEQGVVLHGAAVVLKVDTNEVLALVSYPTFDANHFDELYSRMYVDDVNEPLRNRATMSQLEPGSTVKPLCGLSGVTAGVVGVNEGIECTGYLMLDGHKWRNGRCWIANSSFTQALIDQGIGLAHHPVPEPHKGHDGNPDGYLTFSDGLERSCNVYFETVADRLGIERLSSWYDQFGLGRPTGIGLAEVAGRLPRSCPVTLPALNRRMIGFNAGIGQNYISATPIQMANATATIARNGLWMRPRLILPNSDGSMPPVRPSPYGAIPDRVQLPLSPEALAAARDGMFRVVNRPAGTGKALVAGDKLLQSAMICGKTGTAQASKLMVPIRDENGKIVRKADGKPKYQEVKPSTPEDINPQAPWYHMTDGRLDHAWYVGFAPADHPQVAFAVLVEYGGSGGIAAASVARAALENCINRGYLAIPQTTFEPTTQTASAEN
jgi:penicillin-binding protein 2